MPPAGEARLFASRTRRRCKRSAGRLWSRLRRKQLKGFRFRRQHPFGPYVVDFFCAEAKLIVEVDGGQHADEGEARARAGSRRAAIVSSVSGTMTCLPTLTGCYA